MPVIDHSDQPMPEPTNKRSVRTLVSAEHGSESLSISELGRASGLGGGDCTPTTPTRR